MSGQSDYLPPGLPFNRGLWPEEYRQKEYLDMRASGLIKQIGSGKSTLRNVELEIEKTNAEYREFFRGRLNYWREYQLSRDKANER
ncbi:hypothetical protein [Martelella alba]|uniref:Uncharacterized protein n=1 Tax=Martelella alba TaxID=2590451 RepID=A0ABY2SET8_9HYPH|nr:hypothetical protein [Martelella alba]TKI02574.1 hypothetical protein FCN80_24635 [Martelella alba]